MVLHSGGVVMGGGLCTIEVEHRRESMVRLLIANMICCRAVLEAAAVEHVTLRRDAREQQVEGKLIVTAEDGGLLVLAADGVLWAIPPGEIVAHTKDEVAFEPLTSKQMAARLLEELPPTEKYVWSAPKTRAA